MPTSALRRRSSDCEVAPRGRSMATFGRPALWAIVLLLLTACAPTTVQDLGDASTASRGSSASPPSPAATVPPATVLRVGVMGAVESLDPRSANRTPEDQVMFAILEPLLALTPEHALRPHLATGWNVADDGRSIRLDLRPGVRFHDGKTFTSEDVRATLESRDDDRLERVDTPDSATAILLLRRPAAEILYDLASIPMMPAGATGDFGSRPIGTGPFEFEAQPSAASLSVQRFDDYWGDRAAVDRVEFSIFATPAELTRALVRGDVDLAQTGGSRSSLSSLTSARQLSTQVIPGWTIQLVIWNTSDGPLADARVRAALEHLIPRDRIVEEIDGDALLVARQTLLGKGTPWSDAVEPRPFDPVRARALLAEADATFERPLVLLIRPSSSHSAIAAQLEASFAREGITLRTEVVDDFRAYLDRANSGDYDALLAGFAYGANTVGLVLNRVRGLWAPPAFADGPINDLADAVTRTDASSGEGAEALRELLRALGDEATFATVVSGTEIGAHAGGVRGWEPHPVAALAYRNLAGVSKP